MPIPAIHSLGDALEKRWRAVHYSPAMFPELAANALADAGLHEQLKLEEIIAWFCANSAIPEQTDLAAKFGQPPITLYRGRRFYIDALCWVDGTTTIHQHAFSGAFGVLCGSSIETRFRFEIDSDIDGRLQLGRLNIDASDFLPTGSVRPIVSGREMIHSLFHLERPSVSIVVRTYRDPIQGPQYNYVRPGIAYDPFFPDQFRDRALQVVKMLRTIAHPKFGEIVGDLIADSGLYLAYRILSECAGLSDPTVLEVLLARVENSTIREMFREALREERRLNFLHSRRGLVKEPDLRFFLGVLLNAYRRIDVMNLVRARGVTQKPERVVTGWLRGLSNLNAKLQLGGVSWEPNLLGLPEMNDEVEAALEAVLSDHVVMQTDSVRDVIAHMRELPSLSCLWT